MTIIEIEIISKEIIKPSSPTPNHLRHYQLSFLDQISPPVYNPLVLFYSQNSDKSDNLKISLSKILTVFYPLAGRLKENDSIDCNDNGVPFFETQVNLKLEEIVSKPIPNELNKLVPFILDEMNEQVFGVQFNVFKCGGIAIGLCISHKVVDALSFFNFVKNWAAISRGVTDVPSPLFVANELFPCRNLMGFKPGTGIIKENIVTKRFIFSEGKISALVEKYSEGIDLKNQRRASRVEALSAFIWTRYVDMTRVDPKSDPGPKKLNTMVHAVNLRTRIEPPLPEYAFGNLYRVAVTIPVLNSAGECESLVSQVRDSIRKIDGDHVKQLQNGNQHLDFIKERAERFVNGEIVSFGFTSLCRFPLYDADFGWGKPVWVGSPALSFKNLVVFMDTKNGDGIEAYVSLKVEDMAKFESDKVFLEFISPTGC